MTNPSDGVARWCNDDDMREYDGGEYVLHSDYASLQAKYERAVGLLEELRDYMADNADVIDGPYGEPAPNKPMHYQTEIEQFLSTSEQGK